MLLHELCALLFPGGNSNFDELVKCYHSVQHIYRSSNSLETYIYCYYSDLLVVQICIRIDISFCALLRDGNRSVRQIGKGGGGIVNDSYYTILSFVYISSHSLRYRHRSQCIVIRCISRKKSSCVCVLFIGIFAILHRCYISIQSKYLISEYSVFSRCCSLIPF